MVHNAPTWENVHQKRVMFYNYILRFWILKWYTKAKKYNQSVQKTKLARYVLCKRCPPEKGFSKLARNVHTYLQRNLSCTKTKPSKPWTKPLLPSRRHLVPRTIGYFRCACWRIKKPAPWTFKGKPMIDFKMLAFEAFVVLCVVLAYTLAYNWEILRPWENLTA